MDNYPGDLPQRDFEKVPDASTVFSTDYWNLVRGR